MGLAKTSAEDRGVAAVQRLGSRIPAVFLAALNERADIAELIGRHVKLKKAGADNLVGLCPFHQERSPSFTVAPSKGFYHCFGCGAHGSALGFIMEFEGLGFRDAVRELAAFAGMPLPEGMTEADKVALAAAARRAAERDAIIDVNKQAARYYVHGLRQSGQARDYLANERQLDVRALHLAGYFLGYAPGHRHNLMEAFPGDYATNAALLASGLVRKVDQDGQARDVYDLFRSRVMFAMRDMRGQIIAFGGRVLQLPEDGKAPKYLNSPESAAFDKGRELFGLFEAREAIRQSRAAFVFEGYLDVLSLASVGVRNVVATMGTALTAQHIERLSTQCDRLVLCFDGDAAGTNAARRAVRTLLPMLSSEIDVRVMSLPDGYDPDDLVRERGVAAFHEAGAAAPDALRYLLTDLARENDCAHAAGRTRFLDEVQALRAEMPYGRLSQEFWRDAEVIAGVEAAGERRVLPLAPSPARPERDGAGFWLEFIDHMRRAPRAAMDCAEAILDLLDFEEPMEARIAEMLRTGRFDAAQSPFAALSAGDPATQEQQPAGDDIVRTKVSEDYLRSAARHIEGQRLRELKAECREAFRRGELSEREYFRQMQDIGASRQK